MVPSTQQRKSKNSSKVNLLISLGFHSLIAFVVLYFAAQSQMGQKLLKKIGVEMVKKEKPPEKPKEPEKPKKELPKPETPKVTATPKIEVPRATAPTAVSAAPPAAAPPAMDVASFSFDGGKKVDSISDPVQLYKGQVEYSLRSKWNQVRPGDLDDKNYVAEVEVTVDKAGKISDTTWMKGSGNTRWDDSVKQALAQVKGMSKPPPANFPGRVLIRFDVVEATPIVQ